MGSLKIISVTGAVPHSACHIDYELPKYADGWLGFGPAQHHSPGWPRSTPGKIFTDDESHRVNHGVVFSIPDAVLFKAAEAVVAEYSAKNYRVGVVDCVSFTAEIARQCGLGVPILNFTPYGLIQILAVWNNYEEKW